MLTPTVVRDQNFFHAFGNRPAMNLKKCVPDDATILSLGCGDVRDLLYTCYINKDKGSIDLTCCDHDDKVLARNVVLLTMIIDGKADNANLWDIYYHLYLDDRANSLLKDHLKKLWPQLRSLSVWEHEASKYSEVLKFCDRDTIQGISEICKRMAEKPDDFSEATRKAFRADLQVSKQYQRRPEQNNQHGLNKAVATAPLTMALATHQEGSGAFQYYDKHGAFRPVSAFHRPNAMFSSLVSQHEPLDYKADPTLGFHLASGLTPLTDTSPLLPKPGYSSLASVRAARTQLFAWIGSFRGACKNELKVRFACADAFAFCHTLQLAAAASKTCANWYRRQFDPRPLKLHEPDYNERGKAPKSFDVVHTGRLADHLGTVNLVASAAPLLRDQAWATIHTETLLEPTKGCEQPVAFLYLMHKNPPLLSLLLGVSPVEPWTNAKCDSPFGSVAHQIISRASPLAKTTSHCRLSWKLNQHISNQRNHDDLGISSTRAVAEGNTKDRHIQGKPQTIAALLFDICREIFGPFIHPGYAGPHNHFEGWNSCAHGGSFAALIKSMSQHVATDWPAVFGIFFYFIHAGANKSTTLLEHSSEILLHLQIQQLVTGPIELLQTPAGANHPLFKDWPSPPDVIAITVLVPRTWISKQVEQESRRFNQELSAIVQGFVRSAAGSTKDFAHRFGDVHACFGQVNTHGSRGTGDFNIEICIDENGWGGDSDLVISFLVPRSVVISHPEACAGICIPPSKETPDAPASAYAAMSTFIQCEQFEREVSDESGVFISATLPGQDGHFISCGRDQPLEDATQTLSPLAGTTILLDDPSKANQMTKALLGTSILTGHFDLSSSDKQVLRGMKGKQAGELRQAGPFIIEVVFGKDELVCPVHFPVPVSALTISTIRCRSRVAYTTGFVEVIAPYAVPTGSRCMEDFMFPSTQAKLGPQKGVIVPINLACLNLDQLPVVDLNNKPGVEWLKTLTSLQASERERRILYANKPNTRTPNLRCNFKESIRAIFSVTAGLDKEETRLISLRSLKDREIYIFILVSAIRLDGDAGSAILDAGIVPVSKGLKMAPVAVKQLSSAFSEKSYCVTICEEELKIWWKAIPALVERCRTWKHKPSCQHESGPGSKQGAFDFDRPILCDCGKGKFPENYGKGMTTMWKGIAPYAHRAAISPFFGSQCIEKLASLRRIMMEAAAAAIPPQAGPGVTVVNMATGDAVDFGPPQ